MRIFFFLSPGVRCAWTRRGTYNIPTADLAIKRIDDNGTKGTGKMFRDNKIYHIKNLLREAQKRYTTYTAWCIKKRESKRCIKCIHRLNLVGRPSTKLYQQREWERKRKTHTRRNRCDSCASDRRKQTKRAAGWMETEEREREEKEEISEEDYNFIFDRFLSFLSSSLGNGSGYIECEFGETETERWTTKKKNQNKITMSTADVPWMHAHRIDFN